MISVLQKALIFLCFISLSVLAIGETKQQDFSERFSKKLLSFNSLNGKFKQIIKSDKGLILQETAGLFYIQKPGLFRWEVQPPYEQLIIGTPETLWVYDPDLEQVIVQAQDGSVVSPSTLLSGDVDKLLQHYTMTSRNETETEIFTLVPSDSDEATFSFRELHIEFKQNRLVAMSIIDGLNQRTHIQLSDTEKDQNLDPALFSFTAPESVDVIIDG